MATLQELVDGLAERLGRPVSIDDRRYRVLAYSAHAEAPDALRVTSILTRTVPPAVAAWLDARGLPEATGPVRLPANPGLGMGPRVALPVRADGLLGFLWLFDEPAGDAALAAAAEAAAAAAPELARLRAAERSDHALVAGLLHGVAAARGRAAAALRERGLRGPVRVLAGADLQALRVPRHRIALGDGAAVLAGDLDPAAGFDARAAVGASAPRAALEDAPAALAEAELAHALAAPLGRAVVRWEELGAYQLLAPLAGAPLPAPLERLLAHPDAAPLTATLEAYLDRAGDARGAAAALFVHRTTLYHRLRRIEAITGADLRDGDDRLLLHMGLRLRRLRGLR